jgi:uncharacterized protein YyaL (SSP411 family)
VWGGAYQYSTHGDWAHPHFEKIMSTQAAYLRSYALAYAAWHDERHLAAARAVARYLRDFLTSPEGAFYVSQDADLVPGEHAGEYFALDDAHRRALGMPRVDTHVYARENGLAIEGLALLAAVSGDADALAQAERAARAMLATRRNADGGFAHGAGDASGPYLGDTLAMGRALLALYRATGDRAWLDAALAAGRYIGAHFRNDAGGFASAVGDGGPIAPAVALEENVALVRFANLLGHYGGAAALAEQAAHGMRHVAAIALRTGRADDSGILLADAELAAPPAHLTVVGARSDAGAATLHALARSQSGWYVRVEWWDPQDGALPNPDVRYPVLRRAAGFVCAEGRCSLPSFDESAYARMISALTAPQHAAAASASSAGPVASADASR